MSALIAGSSPLGVREEGGCCLSDPASQIRQAVQVTQPLMLGIIVGFRDTLLRTEPALMS